MNKYINLYKHVLLFFLAFFPCYYIQSEEAVDNIIDCQDNLKQKNQQDQLAKQIVQKINGNDSTKTLASISKAINKIDVLIRQETMSIINLLTSDFELVVNRLTNLADNLVILASIINNLSVVAQLSLISTSVANPALTTPFELFDLNYDVTSYNAHIIHALDDIITAIKTPSKINTISAQAALDLAISDFLIIQSDHDFLSVRSLYSIAEIYNALMQLNAQLSYLYVLQAL